MAIEFTCLSCTRTFGIHEDDLLRMNYLACSDCGKPVPADLLNALKKAVEGFSTNPGSGKAKPSG